jgi:hypothetical protein
MSWRGWLNSRAGIVGILLLSAVVPITFVGLRLPGGVQPTPLWFVVGFLGLAGVWLVWDLLANPKKVYEEAAQELGLVRHGNTLRGTVGAREIALRPKEHNQYMRFTVFLAVDPRLVITFDRGLLGRRGGRLQLEGTPERRAAVDQGLRDFIAEATDEATQLELEDGMLVASSPVNPRSVVEIRRRLLLLRELAVRLEETLPGGG